ncbi:hypothetical protein JTE90_001550 [Oedothorax gibbosus]|uniref:G-protein coupled receptors family 2 profile 1 domain-containing protein n=1 Tax=Oedothorax gibbosus TaxID=931172 RepID=A0AAV6VP12_9ARAC|nr:hypothetical protein JTE90_001550 [Oedothorax gibbosus]
MEEEKLYRDGASSTIYPEIFEEDETAKFCNNSHENLENESIEGVEYCPSSWDGLSCWPTTQAGQTAILPCFEEFNGVKYDVSGKFS